MHPKLISRELEPAQRNLLIYLESRMVDNNGLVDTRHMNDADVDIAKEWDKIGYIRFGRLKVAEMQRLGPERDPPDYDGSTHYVRLSVAAWVDAHAERHARSLRMVDKFEVDNFQPEGLVQAPEENDLDEDDDMEGADRPI